MIPKQEQERILRKQRNSLVYGYCRVSRIEQVSGDSLESQRSRIQAYAATALANHEFGKFFVEKGKSAYSIPFSKRPAGRQMLQVIRSGDHICVDRLDRMCRSVRDAANMLAYFKSREINVHFLDIRYNPTDPHSELLLHQLSIFAQLESSVKSSRVKEVFEIQKREGRFLYSTKFRSSPRGYRCCGLRRKDDDPHRIRIYIHWLEFAAAKWLSDERSKPNRKSLKKLADCVEKWSKERKGETFKNSTFEQRDYSPEIVRTICHQWRRNVVPLIESLGRMPYPPEPSKQDSEILFATGYLNAYGEVDCWQMAFSDEKHTSCFPLVSI